MKITKSYLKQLIKEETKNLKENTFAIGLKKNLKNQQQQLNLMHGALANIPIEYPNFKDTELAKNIPLYQKKIIELMDFLEEIDKNI